MAFLVGGVVVAVALTALNLVLTVGVIRRLREHSQLLSTREPDIMLAVGDTPGGFTAVTTDGEHVSRAALVGDQLVGFFSPGCGPCAEMLPRFVAGAAAVGRSHALAVVASGSGDPHSFVTRLEPVARVVVERDADPGSVSRAFAVKGFPALCRLDAEKVVTASGDAVLDVAPSRVR